MKDRLTPGTYLLALATVLIGAIAYYFLVSLPAHNAALLGLEREKLHASQVQRIEKEAAEIKARAEAERQAGLNENFLDLCKADAERRYWSYVKLNGEAVYGEPGVYRAPGWVWDDAQRRKKADLDECYRRYRQ